MTWLLFAGLLFYAYAIMPFPQNRDEAKGQLLGWVACIIGCVLIANALT